MILGLVLAIIAAGVAWNQTGDNFHTVQEGACYRSAQPSPSDLERYVREYHIRSVINLRGAAPGRKWYDREVGAAGELDLEHYDIRMPVKTVPTAETVDRLLRIYREAPRPILIHCRRGADRSGLAGGIWKLAVEKTARQDATSQLSIQYGHVPLFGREELDRFVREWVPTDTGKALQSEEPAALERKRAAVNSGAPGSP